MHTSSRGVDRNFPDENNNLEEVHIQQGRRPLLGRKYNFMNERGLSSATSSINTHHLTVPELTCSSNVSVVNNKNGNRASKMQKTSKDDASFQISPLRDITNGSLDTFSIDNHVPKRRKPSRDEVPFLKSPLSDITNVIDSFRQPGLCTQIQNLSDSMPNNIEFDLKEDNLVENTLVFGVDVPVEVLTNTSRNSTTNIENHVPKRRKSSGDVVPFLKSQLSDITNVIGNVSHPGPCSLTQTQNLSSFTPNNISIDLNDDNLVENTLIYGVDVPIEVVTNSSIIESVDNVIISTEKPKRPYKRRNPVTTTTNGTVKDINKPKRTYVRKNSASNHSHKIPEVAEKITLPRKNISRKSSKTMIAVNLDETVIDRSAHPSEYGDLGDAIYECRFCNAQFWFNERSQKRGFLNAPYYNGCCNGGIVDLPRLVEPPDVLRDLLHGTSRRSKHFQENIRSYNSMFCFTSMGGKVDHDINKGSGPPIFRLHGQNYHLIGGLIPEDGSTPKFAQMYIYDTENEVSNRKNSMRGSSNDNNLCEDIIDGLKQMLDDNNKLVKSFRMAKDKIKESGDANVRLRLIGKRKLSKEEKTHDLPTCSEVAVLVVGDFDSALGPRDIMVESKSGKLTRINELNVSYLALQYPLLFPYGEDGFTDGMPFSDRKHITETGRKYISPREYFAFRLHDWKEEASTILTSRRLFQQYIVDTYTMVETFRLNFVYFNQKKLRCDVYSGLEDAVTRGDCDPKTMGKRIILPSSFTGGARFMIQNYQDAMAICRRVGYPDLFITFTCNPNWPEIIRFTEARNLRHEDRPDIVSRIFKLKLEELIRDMKKNKIFGRVVAVVYTIEFQKRGLPHVHILLFLAKENKYPTPKDIDLIISAEIPDKKLDPMYYEAVRTHMIHGPCGMVRKNSPCMADGKCTKHFPKKYVETTVIDDEGYPRYRRRDNGRTVDNGGVPLDNKYVVPHNRFLLMKFGAHINVEWCNQSRSIKYLFKYVNKGNDRVTAEFYQGAGSGQSEKPIDEVKIYYD
ncbi:hypothetical protein CASFOL_026203 [Castilleja foliolosa]|uniref:Helitron helicase-like domain-containing protein n=1 Tax=Castilleja foliolosa TaxID=1961234 RepID=A0ABD3CLR8_9LAMI